MNNFKLILESLQEKEIRYKQQAPNKKEEMIELIRVYVNWLKKKHYDSDKAFDVRIHRQFMQEVDIPKSDLINIMWLFDDEEPHVDEYVRDWESKLKSPESWNAPPQHVTTHMNFKDR